MIFIYKMIFVITCEVDFSTAQYKQDGNHRGLEEKVEDIDPWEAVK